MGALWPMALIIFSDVIYHICTKSAPGEMNPFATLTVTYVVGAVASLLLYLIMPHEGNLLQEYGKLNWAPFVLGLSIIGLEGGFLYAYKLGWQVSVSAVVQCSGLAVLLLLIGALAYHEPIGLKKLLGIAVCLTGLVIINS